MLAETEIKPTLNPVLKPFWLEKARNKVLYGGRMSSKSWDAAGMAVFLAQKYGLKFLCTRQFQNKIEESVYSLLKTRINQFNLGKHFKILNNKILCPSTGGEFVFYGLWRHIDEIKSIEGFDICWIEEAHNLLEEQWRILDPTIRKMNSEFWIIFNPQLATDFVYQRFVVNPPPNTIVRKINYDENPFLNETNIASIEAIKAESEEEYNHIYLGYPMSDDDQVIIKSKWVQACIDAHKKLNIEPSGEYRIGFDVADDGVDKNSEVHTHGLHTYKIEEWKGGEDQLMQSCEKVYSSATEHSSVINYDSIGVGAHCGSKFKEMNAARKLKSKDFIPVRFQGFNAGSAVNAKKNYYKPGILNGDFFYNRKAQLWWTMGDMMRHTYNAVNGNVDPIPEQIVSIDSSCEKIDELITELSTPRKEYMPDGRVKVESKKDLAKRGIPSHNIADAFIMSNTTMKRPRPKMGAI